MAELIVENVSTHLREGETTIGRAPDNSVVLDDPTISAYHAVIQKQNGTFTVRDLNSSNGMKVNGARVIEAKLTNGDRIKFGGVECVFQATPPSKAIVEHVPKPPRRHQPRQSFLYRLFSGPAWICPLCGSDDLKTTKAKAYISVSGDRLCRSCGAAWAPPVPKWAASLMFLILVGLTVFTVYFMQERWLHDEESAKSLAELQKRSDELMNNPILHVLEPDWKPRTSATSPPVVHRDTAQTFGELVLAVSFMAGSIACIPVLLGKTGKLKMYHSGKPPKSE